mmetsp:Transcript_95057/g.271816  ORF Transcript_95057/g.271816 Transcript_95057/m.271816 type:complete len:162 (-) Transcript_95057:192-677(-)
MPLLAHPLPVGKEKQENDLAMKRLRLMPIPKRIEAAVLQNKPWCVEELYLQGCPPDEPNRMGYRPLHLAASYNYEECVKVLLHMKMDVELNSTTSNGYTPLYIASSTRAVRATGGPPGRHRRSRRHRGHTPLPPPPRPAPPPCSPLSPLSTAPPPRWRRTR